MAATQQGSVTVHEKSGMPIMLTQAIIIAATLCVCELVCAPMYVGFIPNLFPLLPWALVAMLLAVAFTYIVGFALLWCAESFAYRMKRKAQPIVYSIIGAIAFAVWTIWVVLGIMNMIAGPATGQIVSKNNTVIRLILLRLSAGRTRRQISQDIDRRRHLHDSACHWWGIRSGVNA